MEVESPIGRILYGFHFKSKSFGHWNGSLLDSVDAVISYACTMTWKGKHPIVELVTSIYQTGIKLTKKAMDTVENQLQRLPSLEKWFVDIMYHALDHLG